MATTPHSSLNLSLRSNANLSLRSNVNLSLCSDSNLSLCSKAFKFLHLIETFWLDFFETRLALLQNLRRQMLGSFSMESARQCLVPLLLQLSYRCRHCQTAIYADHQIFRSCMPDPLCLDAPLYRYLFD